jgi:hypothetical protein
MLLRVKVVRRILKIHSYLRGGGLLTPSDFSYFGSPDQLPRPNGKINCGAVRRKKTCPFAWRSVLKKANLGSLIDVCVWAR